MSAPSPLQTATAPPRTLIDDLLDRQQQLTAVERFSQKHAALELSVQSRYYQDLIPASRPGAGQQYAFSVDLDACTGCKACVSACHSLNGLEDHETWRDVGLIVGGPVSDPYLQTVTTACHHCLEPACLEGCPVLAYDKDPQTGIVRHLDDQCIGCQYCTMKCPYDVPKYSHRLGIVRKCDMCSDRLAVGEAPPCVQACPHEAIAIRLVDVADVRAEAAAGSQLVPGAFDSSYTKPATRYVTKMPIPADTAPADAYALRVEHAHWPLILMLVFSQMAAGTFAASAVTAATSAEQFRQTGFVLAAFAFLVLHGGLAASVLHLGRPLGAWRFFLGLRTSWMSREILAFGIFAGAAFAAGVAAWFLPGSIVARGATGMAAIAGLGAVFTSVMIYVDTRRAFWSLRATLARFYGATLVLGTAAAAAVIGWVDRFNPADMTMAASVSVAVATIIRTSVFAWEIAGFSRALSAPSNAIHRSALTIRRLLPWLMPSRLALFAAATILSILAIFPGGELAFLWASLAFLTTTASQVLERFSFFTAVVGPRMPGGI